MGNRNIESRILIKPCELNAALVPRLKQPDDTIQLVPDQRRQMLDVLLHAAAEGMGNKQPPRAGSLTQPI